MKPTGVASSKPPVKLGVIGCGNVMGAYRAVIERLRARGAAEVVVACGREAQREAASAQLAPHRFTTAENDVISSPEVELVILLTPMKEHARLARAALEAGKHVLLEKPLATSMDEALSLVECARQNAGHLLCAPFTLLSPTFQTMARRIRAGDIGRPCSARARYGWSGPDWSDWFYKPGGGCLFDLAVYSFTSLTGLLGPVKRVMAMTGVAIPEREIQGRKIRVEAEDNAQVLLDFGDSTFAVVTAGFTLQQYRTPAIEIYGTTGTIQMLGDDWDPEGYELWQNSVGAWQCFKETAPDWPWTDGLNHLVESLRTGAQPLISPDHPLHVLEIMLKAQQSGREGRALELETTFVRPALLEARAEEPAHLQHDRSREH